MKRHILFVTLLLGIAVLTSNAQVTDGEPILRKEYTADSISGWTYSAYASLMFNQAYFKNWAAGGIKSVATTGIGKASAFYKKDKNIWDNTLDLTYGTIQKGESSEFQKSDDKIEFTSKYGRYAAKNWFYAALLNGKTQFTIGYDYTTDSSKTSNFLAPGYLLAAVGMDFKPNNKLSAFVTPVSARYIFVTDQELADVGAYGVDAAVYNEFGTKIKDGANFRQEIGGYIRIATNFELVKNVGFDSKLNLFSNYMEKPENIDIDWEVMLSFTVNNYISANIKTQMIYDDDIPIPVDENKDGVFESNGPRLQFKEMFGIGITYKL